VQYNGKQTLLQRPVGWAEAGLYATPTNEGLRFAGTVEIAGLSKPAGNRNIQYLTNRAKEMFALKETPDQTWLGFRPTLPDALPVIGYSLQSPHIVYGFGHQHIGLTLAGITGKLVAEVVAEVETSVDISAFSPARFSA
jgi:glycine/D-amino acid oxidase-like deaminating enzyme